ncbi:hypothetical protein PVAND_007282 [Polypedilum vanderplanki]|uniref:Uncharacterized protein n=1 Tax=Polypedilum vanderplanki TaxID=319348 RepID=A0A9J6C6C3_POLVA|nr:hypothetical protein PVAND_007282 [Polypedilum vanderplanki]
MESFNNFNNLNIESEKKKKQQFAVLKKILKTALKKLTKKSIKKVEQAENRSEEDDNKFNEMLERRMEAQENLINEQIVGKQEIETIGYCFVENEHGKFYWSSDINRFVPVDRDLIASTLCSTTYQQAQVQCY